MSGIRIGSVCLVMTGIGLGACVCVCGLCSSPRQNSISQTKRESQLESAHYRCVSVKTHVLI